MVTIKAKPSLAVVGGSQNLQFLNDPVRCSCNGPVLQSALYYMQGTCCDLACGLMQHIMSQYITGQTLHMQEHAWEQHIS